jgi:hypothetical protein
MSITRIRVQLQEGHNDIQSVTNERIGLTFLEIAMAVRTLHENTRDLFPKKNDQVAYDNAVERLCAELGRARSGRFIAQSAGNQFREKFQATRGGKTATYRIDIEVAGPIAVA